MIFSRIDSNAVAVTDAVIVDAVRCWRAARDAHCPVQPCLNSLLAEKGLEMLTPALDSLLTLGESCMHRPLCAGCPHARSDDEYLLCALIASPTSLGLHRPGRQGTAGVNGLFRAFICAVHSVRLMLDQAIEADGQSVASNVRA